MPEEIESTEAFIRETTRGSKSVAEAQSRVRWAIERADPSGPIPAIAETMVRMGVKAAVEEAFAERDAVRAYAGETAR